MISLSVSEMREGLLQKEFSAVELVGAHLERIKRTNETLNSFITITESQALTDAAKADAEIQRDNAKAQADIVRGDLDGGI